MTDTVFAIAIAAADPTALPERIELFRFGVNIPRDGRSPYRFDRADAETVLRASLARMVGGVAPIDFDHTLAKASVGEAAGWITGYEIGPTGIMATVEWSAAGQRALIDKTFRFVSPVFLHAPDGKLLAIDHASLTNIPNLARTAIASAAPILRSHTVDLTRLREQLGLSADADDAAVLVAAEARLAAAPPPVPATDPAAPSAPPVPAADPAPAPAMAAMAAMEARLVAMEQRIARDQAAIGVDAAISAGQFVPAQRDALLALAAANPTGWQALVTATPANPLGAPLAPGGRPQRTGGPIDDGELTIASMLGVGADDYRKAREVTA